MGTHTIAVHQEMTTKLAEARGGELNAATALRRLRLTLERTLNRADTDALNVAIANEEQMGVGRRLVNWLFLGILSEQFFAHVSISVSAHGPLFFDFMLNGCRQRQRFSRDFNFWITVTIKLEAISRPREHARLRSV